MGPVEIIVIVAAALFVAAVIGWNVYRRLTGKSGGCEDCGYGCGGCHGCGHCAHGASKTPDGHRDPSADKNDN